VVVLGNEAVGCGLGGWWLTVYDAMDGILDGSS
jgi:hypothetical protein